MKRPIKRPLPVEPEPWQWWVSRYEEGPWHPAGPTREIAIDEAIGQDECVEVEPDEDDPTQTWKAGFYLCQCRRRVIDLSTYFDADEWLSGVAENMDANEDGSDDNGDYHPLEDLTDDDMLALEECVRTAIWHWQNRRGLCLSPWWLDMKGNPEWVTVPLPKEDDA